ncbi:uncharacterized protein LOC127568674 [Pristis pectinata]|uniref:uncharacterized protein LOC127568674 n=1 Tax=Pristis pectinata TaxID=685728 RepID=UPI00223C97D6|nr:uncharacterized protein LOC127568674 [Pristis pectinata]
MSGSQCQVPLVTGPVSESFSLMVQARINWEMFLTPMSSSIAILADLVRQAKSGKDVPLNPDPKNPGSFQGSLLDICLQAPRLFQDIRNNIFKIQCNCQDMPVLLKKVREGFGVDTRLPQKLKLIQNCTKECRAAAGCVEETLSSLNKQLSELLERCAASQCCSQAQLQEVQAALGKTRQGIQSVEEEKKALEEEWSQVSLEREKLMDALNDVKSRAFTDTLCEEGLRELREHLPQVLDLLGSVINPTVLVSELGKGVKFIISEISALRNKDSSSALSAFLDDVEKKASQKIEEVQSQMDQAGQKYKQCLREMEDLRKQSAQLSENLTAQRTQEQDISSTLLLMSKDLELLGSIRANWSQAINFIHLIPKLMGDCQKMFERVGGGKDGASTQAIVFQDQVSQAGTIVTLLGTMSGTFVEIYDKSLQGPLKDLGEVLVQEGIDYKLKTIKMNCQRAEEEVHQRARKVQEAFEEELLQGSHALGKLAAQLGPRG